MRLSELLASAGPSKVTGRTDIEVSGLSHDSRSVGDGEMFFAMRGHRADANRFVKDAAARGACAVVSELRVPPAPVSFPATWVQVPDICDAMGRLADSFFGRPSQALGVVGVTGTNGKTTMTYFLESILLGAGLRPAVIGTVSYRFGAHSEPAVNTTPISLELLRLLRRFKDAGATHAVMEISSHALALRRADQIEFDAGVFTNLTRDHLDFHGTREEYLRAKARLFELLGRASSSKPTRTAVLNRDDAAWESLRRSATGADILTYGTAPEADLRAVEVRLESAATVFRLCHRGRQWPASIRLVGLHNVYNALAAAGAAVALGLPHEAIVSGLSRLDRVPGRLEPVAAGQGFQVLVDYAHTDSALETVLRHVGQLPHARLITVFGCGGDRDRTKRGPMGVAACSGSDVVFVTSDNPRGEEPEAIIKDIVGGIEAAGFKNYRIIADRKAAIAAAVGSAEPGDIVLIAGKGHEDTQILKDRTIPFDDREIAREAIEQARRGKPSTST